MPYIFFAFIFHYFDKLFFVAGAHVLDIYFTEQQEAFISMKRHTSIKCSSSSISLVLQKKHVLCDALSFGFWCLPVSIRNICQLVLNLLRDRLIWVCFTWVRYGSIWNSVQTACTFLKSDWRLSFVLNYTSRQTNFSEGEIYLQMTNTAVSNVLTG